MKKPLRFWRAFRKALRPSYIEDAVHRGYEIGYEHGYQTGQLDASQQYRNEMYARINEAMSNDPLGPFHGLGLIRPVGRYKPSEIVGPDITNVVSPSSHKH